MKHFALILLAALTWSVNAQITCVDPLACNFTELGECEFLDDNGMPCVTEGCAIPGGLQLQPGGRHQRRQLRVHLMLGVHG